MNLIVKADIDMNSACSKNFGMIGLQINLSSKN